MPKLMIGIDILNFLKDCYKNILKKKLLNTVVDIHSFETSLIRRVLILSICFLVFPTMPIIVYFLKIQAHYSCLVLLGYVHLFSKLPEFWFLYEKKIEKKKKLSVYVWLFSFLSLLVVVFTGGPIFELGTTSTFAYMVPEGVQDINISTRPYTGFTGVPLDSWINAFGTTAVFGLTVRTVTLFKPRPGGPRLDPSNFFALYNSLKGQHLFKPWVPRFRDTPYLSEQGFQIALLVPLGLCFQSELQRQHPTVTIFSDILSAPGVFVRTLVKRNIDWRLAVQNRHNHEDQVFMKKTFEEAGASSNVVLNYDAKNRLVPGYVIEGMLVHEGPPKSFFFFLPLNTSIEEKTDMVVIEQSWLTKTTSGYKSSLPTLTNYQTFNVGDFKFQVLDKIQADLLHSHAYELSSNPDKAMDLIIFKESRDSTLPDLSLVLDLKAYTRFVNFTGTQTKNDLVKYACKFNEDKPFRDELRRCLSKDQFEEIAKNLEKILLLAGESISSDWLSVGVDIALGITIGIALGEAGAPTGEGSPSLHAK